MNITLSLDEKLVKEVRKIAVDRDTTLTGLVREYLEKLAADSVATGRKRRELEALQRSFEKYSRRMGEKTWTRADLHERK
jgi:glutaredoxin 2